MSEQNIPVEFYSEDKAGKPHPKVETVGDLIEQLKRLPKDLPLSYELARDIGGDGEAEPLACVVYNVSSDKPFLELTDNP